MDRGLNQQAVIYSYVDDLRYIAVVCLVCIPVVLLLKRVKPKAGAAAAAHARLRSKTRIGYAV